MELTKKDIINLINENTKSKVDEMARDISEPSLKKKAKQRPILSYIDKNGETQIEAKDIRKNVGQNIEYKVEGWVLNDKQTVIYTTDVPIQRWICEHSEVFEKILKHEGLPTKLFLSTQKCSRTVHRKSPHMVFPPPGAEYDPEMTPDTRPASNKQDKTRPKYSEEDEPVYKTDYNQRLWILRGGVREVNNEKKEYLGVQDLIKKYLENDSINSQLSRLSIPQIRTEDPKKRNLGTYRGGEISNERINYTIHNFNGYESLNEFETLLKKRLRGNVSDNEYKTIEYHLARQYNQVYQNWEETIKNEKNYSGYTAVYKIDRFGKEQKNLNLTIQSILNILGTKGENSFTWTITFKTKFGKKQEQEFTIEGGLQPDQEIISTKTANFPEDTVFDDKNPIIFNDNIYDALNSALKEVSDKLMSIRPISRLKLSTPTQGEIDIKV
jgi:hypothetical protein